MASGYLKATAVGNLGQDPELRHTDGGTAVLKLRVACNQRVKRGGQWVDEATWVNVTTFGKRAEGLHGVLSKGKQIMAAGRLEIREYEKRDGGKGTDVSIVADDVVLLGGGSRDEQRPSGRGGNRAVSDDYPVDDDLPF